MFVEDEELREIFKVAGEERLQSLEACILQLEQNPSDHSPIETFMRDAHSLKGDAGMLGVKDVQTLAHQLETLMRQFQQAEPPAGESFFDRFYYGLDAIRRLVDEAVTGNPAGVDTFHTLAYMMGAKSETAPTAPTPEPASASATPDGAVPVDSPDPVAVETPEAVPPATPPELAQAVTQDRAPNSAPEDVPNATPEHPQGGVPVGREPRVDPRWDSGAVPAGAAPAADSHATQAAGSPRPTASPSAPAADRSPASRRANGAPPNSSLPNRSPAASPQPSQPIPAPAATMDVETSAATSDSSQAVDIRGEDIGDRDYRIDTIRVATQHLDRLMTQAGELTVTKIRIARRLSELEELAALWEDWSRDTFTHRFLLNELIRDRQEAAALAPVALGSDRADPFGHVPHLTHHGLSKQDRDLDRLQAFQQRLEQRLERLSGIIDSLQSATHEDTARLESVADGLESGIRTLRLLPLSTVFGLFPRMVRDLAKAQGKTVHLVIEGGDAKADKQILEAMKDPLMHAIRNAIDHGIEPPEVRRQAGKSPEGTIWLRGFQTATSIAIEIADDGRGLDLNAIRRTAIDRKLYSREELDTMTPGQIQSLIFAPGFSTRKLVTEVSGRGVGLDVLRANVEELKGTISVNSTPNQGCTLRVQLSTTLATAHVLLIDVQGNTYAVPVEFVETIRLLTADEVFTIEGRPTLIWNQQSISIAPLADLLELHFGDEDRPHWLKAKAIPCIILKVGSARLGIAVDALLDEQDVVLKPQSKILKRVRNVSGATILGTGEVCAILNPQDLIESVRQRHRQAMSGATGPVEEHKPVILLVEDSIATRTQEKRVLEAAGFEVVTAVDGLDGYNKLATRVFDAVISDVQMPNLDGLALTSRIRQHREYSELPVILVTTLASDADRQRGAEAGANAYITKGSFSQEVLIETLHRFI